MDGDVLGDLAGDALCPQIHREVSSVQYRRGGCVDEWGLELKAAALPEEPRCVEAEVWPQQPFP